MLLLAEHHDVVVEDMDYLARLLVDHVKSTIVRMYIINIYERKSLTIVIASL